MGQEFEDIDFDSFGSSSKESTDEGVRKVFGSAENIEKVGSPTETDQRIAYYFYPTWRSQLFSLIGFFALCILGVVVTGYIPKLVIAGPLFSLGDTKYFLHLPILILPPGVMLGKILIAIYDAKFIVGREWCRGADRSGLLYPCDSQSCAGKTSGE